MDLTRPVLECLNSPDEKVKLLAIERLNIYTKNLKEIILINFNEIFEHILTHSSDEESKAILVLHC
jgi:hypothetical protein